MKHLLSITLLLSITTIARAQEAPTDSDDSLSPLITLLTESDDPAFHLDILKGISEALKGRTNIKMPNAWPDASKKLAASPSNEVRQLTQSLSTLFGDPATMAALKKTALDRSTSPDERQRALTALFDAKSPGLLPILHTLLADDVQRQLAARFLASYDDPQTPALLLKHYPAFSAAERLDVLNTFASRESYALILLDALKSKTIPKEHLTAATIRQLANWNSDDINAWIAKEWGAVRTTPEDKLRDIARYKDLVARSSPTDASPARGRTLFANTCAQCHTLFGEGGKVGPDLTGSGRADLDYILNNVVDPNAVIGKDYQVSIVRTKKKRIITGILTREDDKTLTVQTENETVILQKPDIERVRQSDTSMMPEGLLQMLTDPEALDLIAYLRSPSQVPAATH